MPRPIAGVIPIAHTPFAADDAIDFASLERQIDWAFATGADGVATGMVSELLRLTSGERVELTRALAGLCRGRGAFVAGVGAESTRQAVEYAVAAEAAGADAVMAIPPTTARLPAAEVRAYFAGLLDAVAIPVIVQDASGYVGQAIPLAVCVELVDRYGPDRVLFKPEASPLGPNLSALRDATGRRARAFDGSGGIGLVDAYRRGVVGTMPGMEFLPGLVALWRALRAGDESATYRLYLPICALVALQHQAGLDGYLATEKYVMHRRGLFATARRRRPYGWELDDETRREFDRLLGLLDAAVAGDGKP